MTLFLSRKPPSRRFLVWKTRIFAVAAVIALAGMYLDNPYVTGAALVLLLAGMALRFVPERRERSDRNDAGEPGSDSE
jgi:hypothetical protein